MPPAVRPYRLLAENYDLIFTGFRAFIDAAHRAILDPILPRVRLACDLACGTGATALNLAARGLRVYGVDLSPTMCRLSRRKALQRRLPLRVIHADMRSFRLPEPVDLVLCEYDALNHVPRHSDLHRVARAVSRALRPGGWFFFDVNNLSAFDRLWHAARLVEKPGFVLVMNNGHDLARRKAWCDCHWFIRQGRLWRRHTERVEEVCWTPQEIRAALTAAGFTRIRTWDAAPFFPADIVAMPGIRTYYLARRQ